MQKSSIHQIQHIPFLDDLPTNDIQDALRYIGTRTFARGSSVFHTGDPVDTIYVIQQGVIKVSYGNPRGDEKIVNIHQTGDIFGELFLGNYRFRVGIATVLEDAVVSAISERDFIALMERFPAIAINFIRHLTDLQRKTLARMHALMHTDARYRLLGTLHNLARHHCCTRDGWFTVPDCIKQEDIAHMACLNRSTVNVQINDLRQQGVLGGKGRTLTVNTEAVASMLMDAGIEILE